ncbi:MAG TPA: ATP-binding protein [Bacteroidales bacterium]|nr:ATP-binding protein [Bacteroidales bacterium]
MKDIALHILDIIQNSIVAKATLIEISIDEDFVNDSILVTIKDNGCGMSKKMIEKVSDPYTTSRTTRKVGLGIPLLKQNADRTGGYLSIKSELEIGTTLIASFKPSNIDCLPMGDIAGVISLTVSGNPSIDFIYNHKINGNLYTFSTIEVKKVLGDVSIGDPSISVYLKEMIQTNLEEIQIDSIGYKT